MHPAPLEGEETNRSQNILQQLCRLAAATGKHAKRATGVRLLVWEASSMGLHGREGIQARMKQDKMSINHPEQQLQNATSCRCYFTATII